MSAGKIFIPATLAAITLGLTSPSVFAQRNILQGINNPDEIRLAWNRKATTTRTADAPPVIGVFPEFVNGQANGATFVTSITAINMTVNPVDVVIEFFDKSGKRLSVALEGPDGSLGGHFAAAGGTVQGYASGLMKTYSSKEPYLEGWARITAKEPGSIAPTATVQAQSSAGKPLFEVAIGLSDGFEQNVFLPFVNNGSYGTAVALANANATAENATVIARSATDGSELCRTSFVVNPLESGGGNLTNLLPCTAGATGSVQIMADGLGLATISLWVSSDGTITPIAPIRNPN